MKPIGKSTPAISPTITKGVSLDIGKVGIEKVTTSQAKVGDSFSVEPKTAKGAGTTSIQLQEEIGAGRLLARGQKSESIKDLQQLLNRAGVQPPLDADGAFGPKTEQALRQFQTQRGIRIDGIFGPESLKALQQALGGQPAPTVGRKPSTAQNGLTNVAQLALSQGNSLSPSPRQQPVTSTSTSPAQTGGAFAPEPGRATAGFGATRAEREQQAESILKANGQWPLQEGKAYVVQIDQDAPPASASRRDRSAYVRNYTGQTSVFRVQNGRLVEEGGGPMRSASHPGQFTTSAAPDVSGDGSSDIAHIRPGVYQYRTRPNGNGRYNPTSNGQFQVARDINHDGVIDGSEANRRYSATGIQIHAGSPNSPTSIGCQTMPPNDYRRFQGALNNANSGNNNEFTYVLVRRPNDVHGENRF